MNYLTLATATPSFNTLYFVILIGGMLVMMFFTSRGQKKKEKARQAELDALVSGDEVVTIGGFYATVFSYQEADKTFTLKLKPDGTKVIVKKEAIAYKLTPDESL